MTLRTSSGIVFIVAGSVVVANAIVSGTHAFRYGTAAVASMIIAGTACVALGAWQLLFGRKSANRENH